MTETYLQKEIPKQIKEMNQEEKITKKNGGRWFTSQEEIKTREDLHDLLYSFSVKENLTKMLSKIGETTNLTISIQKDIKKFEKGGKFDKEKLGTDIDKLRFLKHELRMIKFGKFQELLTGKVDDYAKKRLNAINNETEEKR